MKQWFWRLLGDPLVARLAARMDHLEHQRPRTHDGNAWRASANVGHGVLVHRGASLTASPSSDITIGDYSQLYGHIWMFGNSTLRIAHHSFVGPGSRIWCSERVEIGSHVLISHEVDIHDTNAHDLDWRARREENTARFERGDHSPRPGVVTAPVIIEDDVWIGFKSTVLKGVRLGRGCVVAAASVVTRDVAPFTLVGGNPATVIRDLREEPR